MRKLTKKQLELTAEHLKMKHEAEMKAKTARVEGIASHMSWWEKIILFFKI